MQIYNFELGAFQANCYIVADEKTKEAVVVDPGASSEKLVKLITENKFDVKYILLTHGHFEKKQRMQRWQYINMTLCV